MVFALSTAHQAGGSKAIVTPATDIEVGVSGRAAFKIASAPSAGVSTMTVRQIADRSVVSPPSDLENVLVFTGTTDLDAALATAPINFGYPFHVATGGATVTTGFGLETIIDGVVSFASGSQSHDVVEGTTGNVFKLSNGGVGISYSTPSVNDQSDSGYVDIGNTRMQWGIIDAGNSADGGLQVLPAQFAVWGAGQPPSYVVQLTLSESTSITGPAADVGVDMWTENLTPVQFTHNRDNDIDFAHIHWLAIGRKP